MTIILNPSLGLISRAYLWGWSRWPGAAADPWPRIPRPRVCQRAPEFRSAAPWTSAISLDFRMDSSQKFHSHRCSRLVNWLKWCKNVSCRRIFTYPWELISSNLNNKYHSHWRAQWTSPGQLDCELNKCNFRYPHPLAGLSLARKLSRPFGLSVSYHHLMMQDHWLIWC